jgi:hypothetical protein
MDAEIRELASQALKIEAKGPAGVRAQALAILALGETNTGRLPRVWTTGEHARLLSRAVLRVADTNEASARVFATQNS